MSEPPPRAAIPGTPMQAGRAWWRAALDFVYPPTCPHCQKEPPVGRELCDECHVSLIPARSDVCRRCSAPVGPNLITDTGCIHCLGDKFAFSRVLALGAYDGSLRQACVQAQHDPSGRIVRSLADRFIERWKPELLAMDVDVVVPVPAHWMTRFARLSAPAAGLAQRLARVLKLPCDPHILRKIRWTPPQTSLTPTQRRNNLRGAFRLARGVRLNGARVLLADDVLTTGTTAHRVASVLRASQAQQVTVAVIARGIGR